MDLDTSSLTPNTIAFDDFLLARLSSQVRWTIVNFVEELLLLSNSMWPDNLRVTISSPLDNETYQNILVIV